MGSIEWTERLSVGVPLLDADHRLFIDLINALEGNAKYPGRRFAIVETLAALEQYARHHFKREEEVMRACDYPHIERHIEKHKEFVRYIDELKNNFKENRNHKIGEEVLEFLKNWLVRHILAEDMAYRPYVENNARATAAAQACRPLFFDAL
ncbi:MAG: bacteriohemerythrin [Alphaproteobacteria bacterium]